VRKGDDLTTFTVPKVRRSGALTSWNPKSHVRLVAENLYLFPLTYRIPKRLLRDVAGKLYLYLYIISL
jgi:hypothetical protein